MKFFTNMLRWLFGIGAFFHSVFAMMAVLSPDQLAMITGIGRIAFSYVWVGQAGMLMFLIALMSIPALYHPEKFRAYVWILAAGTMPEGIYWYWASHQTNGIVFAPLATFWLLLGIAEVLIVLFLAESRVRFTFRHCRELAEEWREARENSNLQMRWFGIVLFIYILLSIIPIYAHLFWQSLLRFPVGEGVLFHSGVWIALSGIELLVLTLILIPTSCAPTKYWSYCWLTVAAHFIAIFFWIDVARHPLHLGFVWYVILNVLFFIVMFSLLQSGAPENRTFSSHNLQEFLSFASTTLALHDQPAIIRSIALVLFLGGLTVSFTLWYYFIREVPDLEFGDDYMQYKYGAIGLSIETRVPYYLFEVLPEVFPELIPPTGGPMPQPPDPPSKDAMLRFVKAMGVIVIPNDAQPQPVGFSLREIGFKTVEPNCALCPILQVQLPPPGPGQPAPQPLIVYGAPNSALDIQSYQWFLYNAAVSPKFNVPTLMDAIDKKHNLGFLDRFFYRWVIIPATKGLLGQLRSDYTWQMAHGRSPQGRGRTDTFNTTKQGIWLMPDDGTTGTTDLPQVWQLGRRHYKRMWLHWDGNNSSVPERNYTAAMAVGASPVSVIQKNFNRLVHFFWRLPAASSPLPIDPVKAAAGREIFKANCAGCHSWYGNKIGQVTQSVGTDPNRSITFTTEHCQDFKKITYQPFYFQNYRKFSEPKYVNVPLDGLWTRGPYLHHGAVPTLWDLLQPPSKRPVVFYRGYNVFDPVKVGFVSEGPEAAASGTLYDTRLPGNCRSGHTYGTNLPDDQKKQLIEYLKTDDPLISGRGIPIPPVDTKPSWPLQPCEAQIPIVESCPTPTP